MFTLFPGKLRINSGYDTKAKSHRDIATTPQNNVVNVGQVAFFAASDYVHASPILSRGASFEFSTDGIHTKKDFSSRFVGVFDVGRADLHRSPIISETAKNETPEHH